MQEIKPLVLPLKTVRNPRDLGGYIGFEGRKIKSHRLLRTGTISHLSDHDRLFLKHYGLQQVIDLRSPLEIKLFPDADIPGVRHYDLALSDQDNTQGGAHDIAKMHALYAQDQYAALKKMAQRYHDHVATKKAQHTMHQILELLAATEEGATIFHCSEGKDRTGIVTLIILYVLGVDLETIRQDYLYSNYLLNDYRAKRDQKFKEAGKNLNFRANMRILGSVADSFLDTALITIANDYGGLAAYVRNQIGVTPALRDTLRSRYLEKKAS